MDNLVTIIRFVYPHQLGIPRSLLESEGIECFVRDELTISVDPFYSNAIGGIKLQVRESDAQRAMEILIEGGFVNEEGKTEFLGEKTYGMKASDGSTCPYCRSTEVVQGNNDLAGKTSVFAAILSVLLLGYPSPFFRRNYHCIGCGKDFKKAKNQTTTYNK